MALTNSQIQEELNKAKTTLEGIKTQAASQNPNITLNSGNVGPASDLPIAPIAPLSSADVSGLETKYAPLTPTTQQQEGSDLSKRLAEINNQLAGEGAFKAQQEEVVGIPGLETTQSDLTAQLQQLQKQSADLQNQYNYTIPNQMQIGAEGRGMTAGGLAPLQASELRKIQIKQGGIASDALVISATLDAVNGRIGNANKKIERAIELKFGPLKAEQKAKTDNLLLLKNDPLTTLAEKNQIDSQLAKQRAIDDKIADQEANQKEIWNIAKDASAAGADSLTLQRIQGATTKEEALQVAVKAGYVANSQVTALMTKYPDAGISYSDTIDVAQAKLKNSRIYQKDVKITPTGNDVPSQPIPNLFTKPEVASMAAGGLSVDDATLIYQAIQNGSSLEEIRQALRDDGKDPVILDVFDRVNPIYKILGQEKPQ